jgi:uncharacterized protein (TIGR02246 family)
MIRMTRRTAVHVVLVAGVVILVSGCVRPALPPVPDARAAADAIFARYAASLSAGDADGWATLWTEDGVQMPPDAPPVVGKSQIREKLRSLLAQFRFEMRIHTEEVRTAGDWAFARGMYAATLTPKAGGPEIPIDGKFMTILARQSDGSWRIYRDIFNSNLPAAGR